MNSGSASALTVPLWAMALIAVFSAAPLAAQSFTPVDTPTTGSTDVFIEQIGSGNIANIEQRSPSQQLALRQDGNDNEADVDQLDGGSHVAAVEQDGDENMVTLSQSGSGETVADISQTGDNNSILLSQTDNGLLGTAAEIVQSGNDNSIGLTQDGTDNQARLTQNGDNNTMTASQLGTQNRLEWLQDGSNLSDMTVEQTGGQTMFILQTN